MSTHVKLLDVKCDKCDSFKVEYHMKNPWIDDFEVECPLCNEGEALRMLTSRARSSARCKNE